MRNSILVIGNTGQLGQELTKNLSTSPYKITSVGRAEFDLTQPEEIVKFITKTKPELIINCAAYTAVDKAEQESEVAYLVNSNAPGAMAQAAQEIGAFFLHVSTDYVFDGKQGYPYSEEDETNPVGVYGKSKLAGEQAIKAVCDRYIILRTAWVYGNYGKGNFVKTMLRLGAQREEISVVADQIGTPTWTGDIADAITKLIPLINKDIVGTYHFTNSGVASWYDFAVAIFKEAKALDLPLQLQRVIPITTAEYPTPAQRPAYSVLACQKISTLLNTKPPHWQSSLPKMLQQLGS